MEKFICRACGDLKPREKFFKDTRNKKLGVRLGRCKDCASALHAREKIEPHTELDAETVKIFNRWLRGKAG